MTEAVVTSRVDYSRHEEVRLLFDVVIANFKEKRDDHFRERQIFAEVLGETPEMHMAFFHFLHDVSTCPPEVIQWCQGQINAKA